MDKMDVKTFGTRLIETRDLDPLYVGLVGAALPEPQLCRWLLSYWCFYHAGVASYMSESEDGDFCYVMQVAAENAVPPYLYDARLPHVERWPRAAERRHFRGAKCVDAVKKIGNMIKPVEGLEQLVRDLVAGDVSVTEDTVMRRVQQWPLFGPWIAFKVADMMERVYGAKVYFDPQIALLYEEPRKALDLIQTTRGEAVTGAGAKDHYDALLRYFYPMKAPPRGDRPCGAQEVETVLCKWKSYMGGHYWIGKDIKEHREGLHGWGETADRLRAAYPAEVSEEETRI